MVKELNWIKEVQYIFEFEGGSRKETLYTNGIDDARYVMYPPSTFVAPSSVFKIKTGAEYSQIKAQLVAEAVEAENEFSKNMQLLYFLPDTGEYVFATSYVSEDYAELSFPRA